MFLLEYLLFMVFYSWCSSIGLMFMMSALMVSFMMLVLFRIVSPEGFYEIRFFWWVGWFIYGCIRCLWKCSVLMSVCNLKMHSVTWLRGSSSRVSWLNWLWLGCFCFLEKLRELSQRFFGRLWGWHCIRLRCFLCWRVFLFFWELFLSFFWSVSFSIMLRRRCLSQESQCCLILRWQHLLLFD